MPDTLAHDGDTLDALVLNEDATFPACHVMARPVAVFWMADEEEPDVKIIGVLSHGPMRHTVADLDEVPGGFGDEIDHFFDMYTHLEPGNETAVKGHEGREAVLAQIEVSRDQFGLNGCSSHIAVRP